MTNTIDKQEVQDALMEEHKANSQAFILIGVVAYHLVTGKALPLSGNDTPILLRSILTDKEVSQVFTRLIVTLPTSALAMVGSVLMQSWRSGEPAPKSLNDALETLRSKVNDGYVEQTLTMAETPPAQTKSGVKINARGFSFGTPSKGSSMN